MLPLLTRSVLVADNHDYPGLLQEVDDCIQGRGIRLIFSRIGYLFAVYMGVRGVKEARKVAPVLSKLGTSITQQNPIWCSCPKNKIPQSGWIEEVMEKIYKFREEHGCVSWELMIGAVGSNEDCIIRRFLLSLPEIEYQNPPTGGCVIM